MHITDRRSLQGNKVCQREARGLRDATYQVVAEKLHDEGRILVALLAQGVELCSGEKRWLAA